MDSKIPDDYGDPESDDHKYIGDPDRPPQDNIAKGYFPSVFSGFMRQQDDERINDPDMIRMRHPTASIKEALAIEIVRAHRFRYPEDSADLEEILNAKVRLEGILKEMQVKGLENTVNYMKLSKWYFWLCADVLRKNRN